MGGSTSGPRVRWTAGLCGVVVAGAALIGGPAGAAATVPDAPTITAATAGQQSATIAFTRPTSDGGAPIVAFRITCASSNGGATVTQSGGKSPITVGGMSVGKKYTCRAAAVNKLGVGNASAPSSVVVPLAPPGKSLPDPPTQLHARAEIEAVRISFTGVYISGGAHVTGYLAVCSSTDGGSHNRQQNSITPITVNHLTAGKTYTCEVASRNPAGFGAFSAPSNAVVALGAHTVPDVPTGVSAAAGRRSVMVTFKKPASDGGESITSYHVSCPSSDGGDKVSKNGANSPILVAGLSAGKAYRCSVSAKNRLGFGKFSAPSNSVVTRN
jgi:Fibronectin type III domain